MSSPTVYVITGANRGIGLKLVETLVARPTTTVIALMRPTSSRAALDAIAVPAGSALYVLAHTTTAAQLQRAHPDITHVDCVIANAGTASAASFVPTLQQSEAVVLDNFAVNTLGPLKLFQALWPLLQAAAQPKFFVMSSYIGSIGGMTAESHPSLAYGASKAAVNYLVRGLHFEHPQLTAVTVHPGWVKTKMGQAFADAVGVTEPPTTVDECVRELLENVIDPATREKSSGKFLRSSGDEVPW